VAHNWFACEGGCSETKVNLLENVYIFINIHYAYNLNFVGRMAHSFDYVEAENKIVMIGGSVDWGGTTENFDEVWHLSVCK